MKYKCSKCIIPYCSVSCYKTHTCIESNTRLDIQKDFEFLEKVHRITDNAARVNRDAPYSNQKSRLVGLLSKLGIELKRMPITFTKSKSNKTYFRGQNIFWTISIDGELKHDVKGDTIMSSLGINLFIPKENSRANKLNLDRIDESLTLNQALKGRCILEYPEFSSKGNEFAVDVEKSTLNWPVN